jgi:hypothetical protein
MLRALTIHQPWAWAIAHAGKRIENRTWKPPVSLVGSHLAIHAGKVFSDDGELSLILRGFDPPDTYVRGAIVAVAKVAGWVERSGDPWFVGPIGWELSELRVFEPVPCKGAQGLWLVPDGVLSIVRERWKAAA